MNLRNAVIQKSENKQVNIVGYIVLMTVLSRFLMYAICVYRTGDVSLTSFFHSINKYDAGWYHSIVESWYPTTANNVDSGQASWAFFPLYPGIVKILTRITGIDSYIMGSICSTVFLMGALWYGYKYIILTRNNEKQAIYYIFLMTFGVYSFYFSILYTESLFLFLLSACFYYMEKCDYIKMGICGALLSATRNIGVFFVFSILIHCIVKYCRENEKKSFLDFWKKCFCNVRLVVGTLLVPLGLFLYMLYLYYLVGDSLAFVHVQAGWWRESVGIIKNVYQMLTNEFPPNYLVLCFLIGIFFLGVHIFKHKRYAESIFPFITLLCSASSSLGSTPRYMIASFAIVLAVTDEAVTYSKLYRTVLFVVAFIFEMLIVGSWINGNGLLI